MLGIERDQNLGIAGADGSVGTVGLVDAGVGQADVVENRLQLSVAGIFLVQSGFDLVAEARRLFHAQAGAGAHMQAQQSRIHLRKEVLPEEHEESEREHAENQEANDEDAAMLERGLQQRLVAAAEVFELALEAALEAAQERLRRRRRDARARA